MDAQLTLLRKKLRAAPPGKPASEMLLLPSEPGSSAPQSQRHCLAPDAWELLSTSPPTASAAPRNPPGSCERARSRIQPMRVGAGSTRAASLQRPPGSEAHDAHPLSVASSRAASASSSRPPLPGARQPKHPRMGAAPAEAPDAAASSWQGRAKPRWFDCCGFKLPLSVLSRIVSFAPVALLPALRRACLCCHTVAAARLAWDPALRSALDFHLQGRRQKSKRVWVVVRARPSSGEAGNCISIDRNRITVTGAPFFFDRAFDGAATQEEVSAYIGDRVLPHALNGEHICLLAYGQTGSGKTYTMFGSLEAGANQGVAFRAVEKLAALLRARGAPGSAAPSVEFSFLEVYNDELYDLLDGQKRLPRQRSSEKHVVPQGLTRRRCELDQMEEQVHGWLRQGAATRTVGRTVFNPRSSRSHGVVMLHICWGCDGQASRLHSSTRRDATTSGQTRIYIVDLAGSERAGLYALAPEQLKEGEHINLSLSALGRVVSALAEGKCEHVPYRDSALTWLLKDAITGTSARVCMVATVHPAHAVETVGTLRYARQYSSLQSQTNTRIPELTSEVREQQRRVDTVRSAFETAMSGDEYGIPWTRESMEGTVQPTRNAKELVEAHPHLSWTPAHQSKSIMRGQRRDRTGIGRIRTSVDVVVPRDPADTPDGRPAAGSAAGAAIEGGGARAERAVEVLFEAKQGRPPVALWYPESAVEAVQPPKKLLDAMEQLKLAEEELSRKRAELRRAKASSSREQQEWMAKEA